MNLIESLQDYLTPELISKTAGVLGESEENTSKAMSGILTGMMGGLLDKSSDTDAISGIFNMISGSGAENISSNPLSLFSDNAVNEELLESGKNFLTSIFGDKLVSIANFISNFAGIRVDSANAMMGLLAPLVMGSLAKQIKDSNLDLSSFTNLVSSQKDTIMAALPARFSSVVGFFGIGNLMSEKVADVDESISNTYQNTTSTVQETAEKASSIPSWLLPLILGIAAIVALFLILRSCNDTTKVTNAADTLVNKPEIVIDLDSTVLKTKEVSIDLGEFSKKKLPDGVEINIPANGIENRLLAFIEDTKRTTEKVDGKYEWFDFDRLLFDTGKATLQATSEEQLENIAKIMNAYPKISLKIGGYTDNTGDKNANLKLSDERAKSVVEALAKRGIDAKRLSGEGYGDQFSVASNETEEGRKQNRRVSARVSAK
ncbi:MAG: OmpA family protein [Verrucomicrobia bacterium]|nr:OmpA family protein [Cytophagales bacterium]